MKMRPLGKDGPSVSEIGLGCWQLGGDFGPMNDGQADAVLDAARDEGITFLDTADVYGAGRSEERVGAHAAQWSERPFIATKVGRTDDLYPDGYDEETVRKHLKASAERMGVETLDLVQLHCVPPDLLRAGTIFTIMDRMQDEGLCTRWGASVETLDEALICLRAERLVSLQMIFNIFRQDAAWAVFDEAKAAGVGIIVRLPLASGVLSGKFAEGHHFDPKDHRNFNRDGAAFSVGETFGGIPFDKAVQLARGLERFVPEGWSMPDLALRWILDHDAVTTVIAGCSKPEQVHVNARASDLAPLSADTHAALRAYYENEVREHIRGGI